MMDGPMDGTKRAVRALFAPSTRRHFGQPAPCRQGVAGGVANSPRMKSFRFASAALLLAVAMLAGSLTPATAEGTGQPRVVVAVIDAPMNPYHEAYHAGGTFYKGTAPSSVTPEVLAEFGIDEAHTIHMTRTGNFASDFAADKAQWDGIRKGEPYWFAGTNVIGISFLGTDKTRLRPEGADSHGQGTTSAVLAANPEAVAVIVETPGGPLTEFGTSPDGEKWAFSHPAVDIISTSYGPPGSPPLGYHLVDSYKGVVTNGKLHFGAADNSPALAPVDATAGPWWSIGIAGYGEGSGETRERLSGTYPDFVGDFTQTLPYCRSCEKGVKAVSGTSFSTPRSAGTMSKILLEARRRAGHLGGIAPADAAAAAPAPSMVRAGGLDFTNWELRRALEEGAYYPTPANSVQQDYSWGAITPDPTKGVVTKTLDNLGFGTATDKGDATCAFMTANITARHAWWDHSPRSQSFLAAGDPYLYC